MRVYMIRENRRRIYYHRPTGCWTRQELGSIWSSLKVAYAVLEELRNQEHPAQIVTYELEEVS